MLILEEMEEVARLNRLDLVELRVRYPVGATSELVALTL